MFASMLQDAAEWVYQFACILLFRGIIIQYRRQRMCHILILIPSQTPKIRIFWRLFITAGGNTHTILSTLRQMGLLLQNFFLSFHGVVYIIQYRSVQNKPCTIEINLLRTGRSRSSNHGRQMGSWCKASRWFLKLLGQWFTHLFSAVTCSLNNINKVAEIQRRIQIGLDLPPCKDIF